MIFLVRMCHVRTAFKCQVPAEIWNINESTDKLHRSETIEFHSRIDLLLQSRDQLNYVASDSIYKLLNVPGNLASRIPNVTSQEAKTSASETYWYCTIRPRRETVLERASRIRRLHIVVGHIQRVVVGTRS